MTTDRACRWALVVYLFAGIITFGYAAAKAERVEAAQFEECKRSGNMWLRGVPGLNGFFAATLWPFYWSWEAFNGDQ